ncbi:hypothetical protein Tco_0559290 [Tanacetum coccineum]
MVRLIGITLEQWLDIKFGNHKKVDKEIKEGVVATWLIRSYRKQFKEYMEIKRLLENNEVPWVDEKPWLEDGIWKEPNDDHIFIECKPFRFKNGLAEWPLVMERRGYGLEDGDLKEEALKEKAILEGSWGDENRKGNNFSSWLKESFSNYHELDYGLMLKLKEYWRGKKDEKESYEDAWSNHLPNDEFVQFVIDC